MEFSILKHIKIKFMKKTLALIQSKLLLVGKGAKNVVYRIKVKEPHEVRRSFYRLLSEIMPLNISLKYV